MQHFCYVFLVVIFLSKIVRFLLHPVVGMFSCHSLPIGGKIFFRCFRKSCFVSNVSPFVDISLIFLFSQTLSGLFPQVVLLLFPVLPVPFSRLFQRLTICVSSRISHPGFDCFSCFLRGSQLSHKLILHLHRLVHLTRLYYPLVCKVVCDLFYFFLS